MSNARKTVYVGNLTSSARESDVEDAFKKYGKIARVDIKNGFSFVTFDDERDAEDASKSMDGKEILGKRISCEPARGGPRRGGDRGDRDDRGDRGGGRDRFDRGGGSRTDKYHASGGRRGEFRLRVEGLDGRTSWQDLKDFARAAGQVAYTDVHSDRGKKVGIIEYDNRDGYDEALRKLDDTKLDGVYVRLYPDGGSSSSKHGKSRSRSRSRGRGRDRSRSRDRSDRKDDRERSRSRDKEKDKRDASPVKSDKKDDRARSPSKEKPRSPKVEGENGNKD